MRNRRAVPALLTLRAAVILALTAITAAVAGSLALRANGSLPQALLTAGGAALTVIGILDKLIAKDTSE
ncbi:hypothetical protein [Dactylosporangium sp. CA-092794]|uniref:hypothetical protein n=1 Tax=Dactylosporangium sp. CA-092794 TaxID=3239929 RepID=UPI003D8BA7E3